jgi:polyphosphate kinase
VEIRDPFDEETNIEWARALERAGVHVVHGVLGLKTHAKLALVVRREGGMLRRYGHIGTGNYNSDTARQYEDVSLFTADPDLCADLSELFNTLTGHGRQRPYRRLLVSPSALRFRLVELIRGQAHPGGSITIKVNNLVDQAIIAELYAAARAGSKIDLIVRSACCLRPGVPGVSEGISVRSIMGAYLEHSRIFRFGGPGEDGSYLIGSADVMPRNLDERVEALAPIEGPPLRRRIDVILETALADDVLAWELRPDGTWQKVETVRGVNVQALLARHPAGT